ncbi:MULTISPECIES: hypothetical protein [Brevibacillus]|uniref:hypothetical protein n=1 Tax=Brevibacillus TaxID=55080 RepID=UPI0025B6AF7B|nr:MULTISPECIES: hypothetical protein [Brevibacillus]MDN4095610.1 hypothetical protein [Brevibacillus agri]MDR9507022.1 hypothetical protein [Brevibacillus agri]WNF05544.1 hypothetical protein RFB14_24980 [Brevibacillus borstelensis]
MNNEHQDSSTKYTSKRQSNYEKAISLAQLAGSAKLNENVDLIKIMREAKGK